MTLIPLYDEQDLLVRLRDGDYVAFETIYHRYNKAISANLFRLLKSRELVEETLQELFLKVWEQHETIHIEQSLPAFLHRVAGNLAYDHFRKVARDQKLAAHLWDHLVASYNPFEGVKSEELDQKLYSLIDQLPAQRKRVFILCKMEGKSYQEVSQMLNISVAAVNDHITKANKFLKANYSQIAPLLVALFSYHLLDGLK